MTHAETQDLLIDLAFGELDPARAAEVESHLAGCAECSRERAALDEARRVSAPLRALEEPSPGFDARIMEAARAEAQLTHGDVGQVIEVQGSVRPMQAEAARIDAHAKVAHIEKRRPRWMMRVAVAGSIAAAASLALVVNSRLEENQIAALHKARPADTEYAIRVQPAAPAAVPAPTVADEVAFDAKKEAEAKLRADDENRRAAAEHAAAGPATGERAPKKKVAVGSGLGAISGGGSAGYVAGKLDQKGSVAGSGGDSYDAFKDAPQGYPQKRAYAPEKQQIQAPPKQSAAAAQPAEEVALAKEAPAVKNERDEAPPPPPPPPPAAVAKMAPKSAPAAAPAAAGALGVKAPSREPSPVAEKKAEGPPPSSVAVTAAPSAIAQGNMPPQAMQALSLEDAAQRARHAGQYPEAAELYRKAAALRRAANQDSNASWDMAHAVECLSAAGKFDEANAMRDQLAEFYPGEKAANSAAGRALREVEAMPAAKPAKPAAPPPAKARTESKDSAIPADF